MPQRTGPAAAIGHRQSQQAIKLFINITITLAFGINQTLRGDMPNREGNTHIFRKKEARCRALLRLTTK